MPGKPRPELKEAAVELRVKHRLGVGEIVRRLDNQVSRPTVSRWLQPYPLTEGEQRAVNEAGLKLRRPRTAVVRRTCINCGGDRSRHTAKYCSAACRWDYDYSDYIRRWLDGEVSGAKDYNEEDLSDHVRRYLLEQSNHSCVECGWSRMNPTTGKVPVQIDHIDGDSRNHRPENLRVLCPSCHSLTPNYMALNKGNGRKNRYS